MKEEKYNYVGVVFGRTALHSNTDLSWLRHTSLNFLLAKYFWNHEYFNEILKSFNLVVTKGTMCVCFSSSVKGKQVLIRKKYI